MNSKIMLSILRDFYLIQHLDRQVDGLPEFNREETLNKELQSRVMEVMLGEDSMLWNVQQGGVRSSCFLRELECRD